jgi:hypothetical protein
MYESFRQPHRKEQCVNRFKYVGSLGVLALALGMSIGAVAQDSQPVGPYKDFKGVIKLDVRDSVPDWKPFLPKKAPEGAPNILFILYDDTGLAAWSPFGGRINMPTLQQLADQGLRYTQWHTTALCSPTRCSRTASVRRLSARSGLA